MDHMDLDRETTDNRDGVEVAASVEPAATQDDPTQDMSLSQRLAAIRDECNGIKKDAIKKEKDGKSWTEKGHIVEVILSEFRPLLSKYGVDMTPNLVERSYTGNRCDIIVDFEFECIANAESYGEKRTIRWAGAGTDNGDKAFAKAGTNALKELIKKRFLVTDRDDAKEETETVEHQPEGASPKALDKAREERRAAIEQWAKTFKAALESAGELKDIHRLQRDNAEQLSSEDLPAVTRTFFIELIESRKEAMRAPL